VIRNKRYSYAVSWEAYVKGNIVSSTSPRYIQNILIATAATKTEDSEDSSDDTDAEQYENFDFKAGSMDLVHQTLKGMCAKNSEEGMKAMGRHARTIRLGRTLWESAPLEPEITSLMQERFFDDGTFPPLKEVKTAAAQAQNPVEERPAPFAGKTMPTSTLSTRDYGQRLASWLQRVQQEEEAPTGEQLSILNRVSDRLLEEFRLEKEGLLLKKTDPERAKSEQPLLGFCHGSPGTGKSKVIKWITRLFTEALEWNHEDEFLCVAFQNRVAHAMGGNTLHAGGDIAVGGQRSLDHTDIDILFTRDQYLRWVIIDELPMVPDDLLGACKPFGGCCQPLPLPQESRWIGSLLRRVQSARFWRLLSNPAHTFLRIPRHPSYPQEDGGSQTRSGPSLG